MNFATETVEDGRDHIKLNLCKSLEEDGQVEGESMEEIVERKVSKLDGIKETVTDLLRKAQAKGKKYYDKKRRLVTYQVGDLVWRRTFPKSDLT